MQVISPYYEPRLAYKRSQSYHKRYGKRGTPSISNYKRALIALLVVASATLAGSWILQRDINAKRSQLQQIETQKHSLEQRLQQTSTDKSKLEQDTKSYQDQIKSKDDQINDLNNKLQARIEQKRQLALTATAEAAAPTAVSVPGDIQGIITAAANAHGVDPGWLLRVAKCESGFNIYAHNPSGATGLFQFMPSTFYGNGGHDLYSASDQANVAAYMFSIGQSGQWVCR